MAYGLPSRGQRDWDDELNNSIEALNADTQSAVANASAAVSTANTAINIAQSVQGAVIGGADVATAAILNDKASASRAALSASITERIEGAERIASLLDFGVGDVHIGVAGDSTGDEGGTPGSEEWIYLMGKRLAALLPDLRVVYKGWATGTENYFSDVVIQTGSPVYSYGTIRQDTFARSGEILGTSTPVGSTPWTSSDPSGGDWIGDGTAAVASADATRAPYLVSVGQQQSSRTKWGYTATSTAAVTTDFFIRRGSDTFRLYISLVRDGAGNASVVLRKRLSGVVTDIATIASAPLPADKKYSITARVIVNDDGTASITTDVNGNTSMAVTLSAADWTAVNGGFNVGINAPSGSPTGDRWTLFQFETVTLVGPAQSLTLWNGSRAGSTLDYQQPRLATMYPTPLHAMIVSSSHNEATTLTGAAYVTRLRSFITAVEASHPGVTWILTSQNPEYAPRSAAQINAHANRGAAVRAFALSEGHVYVPILEKMLAQPNAGRDLMNGDGLHPNKGEGVTSGANFMAGVGMSFIFSRLLRTA